MTYTRGVHRERPNERVDTSMHRKIVFLDVDGVLNSSKNILAHERFPWAGVFDEDANKVMGPESELDLIAKGMIRKLCEITGAVIVLHSMWRCRVNAIDFGKRHNLPIVDATVVDMDKIHGIALWLNKNPQVDQFTIIDDDNITDDYYFFHQPKDYNPEAFPPITKGLWDDLKEAHVRTEMIHGLTFLDFTNAYLCLSEKDIDQIRVQADRINFLTSIRSASVDARTKEEKEADEDELSELLSDQSIGDWAVSVMLGKSYV